jgi:hypothetical protein
MLRDCAATASREDHQEEIERQVDLLLDTMDSGLVPSDTEEVQALADKVRLALKGDLQPAYHDRAGETRSA